MAALLGRRRMRWSGISGRCWASPCCSRVGHDFGYWSGTIWAHKVPALWAFHKVHHSLKCYPAGRRAGASLERWCCGVPLRRRLAHRRAGALFLRLRGQVLTFFRHGHRRRRLRRAGDQLFHAHVPISWGPRLNHIFISRPRPEIHHTSSCATGQEPGCVPGRVGLDVRDAVPAGFAQQITYGVAPDIVQPHPGLVRPGLRPFWTSIPAIRRLPWLQPAAPFPDGAALPLHLQADRCSACAPPEGAPPHDRPDHQRPRLELREIAAACCPPAVRQCRTTWYPRAAWRPRCGTSAATVCRFPARLRPRCFLATAPRRHARCRRR